MRRILLSLSALLFVGAPAFAQDEIFFRSKEKSHKGAIKSESPRGIEVAGLKEPVPWDDIVDITYEVTPVDVRINVYRVGITFEKEYNDPDPKKEAKRKGNLGEALKKYAEAYKKINEKTARRHLEYKIAVLTARQAQDEGADPEPAIKLLNTFKAKHAAGWQIAPAMLLLARLHQDKGNVDAAQSAYEELAGIDGVPEDVKQEAKLAAFRVGIRAGKADLKKLQAFAQGLPKDSKFRGLAKVVEAEGLLAGKKNAEAVTLLRQVIQETSDKSLKAAAYNALGVHFYKSEQLKEALWEFLWVDAVYNSDRDEHAKALYYLSHVFTKLGEPDRGAECRDTLLTDRAFTGLEWQRLAQKDNK